MAEYRNINNGFWHDEYTESLTAEQRLFYFYLITNPHINNAGVFKVTRRMMAFETGIADIDSCIARFIDDGRLVECQGYFWVVKFIKRQTTNSPKIAASLMKILNKLPEELTAKIKETYPDILIRYQKAIDSMRDVNNTLSIPYQDRTDTLPIGSVEPEPEPEPEPELKKEGKPPEKTLSNPGFSAEFVSRSWPYFLKCKQGKPYKNRESQEVALRELFKMCGGDEKEAKEALAYAVANNYQGLAWYFKHKTRVTNGNGITAQSGPSKADHAALNAAFTAGTVGSTCN